MTDKLHCPFCGAELHTRKLLTGMVDYVCINNQCDFSYTPLPLKWWQALIDGKKAQDALKKFNDKILTIDIVCGCEGKSIYIDNYRVAGNKPWGGGTILDTLHCRGKDIIYAIPELRITSITKQDNQ